jgi:hypothetical protein
MHSLFFELDFDLHDLLFFLSELARYFLYFMLQLLFKLNNSLFTTLHVQGFLSQFGLNLSHFSQRLLKLLVSGSFFQLPVLGHLLNLFDFFLFQMHQKLGHLSALPHFKLPNDLIVS